MVKLGSETRRLNEMELNETEDGVMKAYEGLMVGDFDLHFEPKSLFNDFFAEFAVDCTHVVDLYILAALVLGKAHQSKVTPIIEWDPGDQLEFVADWIQDEGKIKKYRVDWYTTKNSLRKGLRRYRKIMNAAGFAIRRRVDSYIVSLS